MKVKSLYLFNGETIKSAKLELCDQKSRIITVELSPIQQQRVLDVLESFVDPILTQMRDELVRDQKTSLENAARFGGCGGVAAVSLE